MGKNGTAKRAPSKARERGTLRWLKIHRFRHVEPCELRFSETFNVLLGLNGTGKTTLLELIAAALTFNFSKMKKEPFFIEYEIGISGGTIVASVRNEELKPRRRAAVGRKVSSALAGRLPKSESSYKAAIELVISSAAGKPRVAFRVDESGGEVEIDGKRVRYDASGRGNVVLQPHFQATLFWWIKSLNNAALADAELVVASVIGFWEGICRFDEALGFLRAVTGASTRIGVEVHRISKYRQYGVSGHGPIPASIVSEVSRQSRSWGNSAGAAISIDQEHLPLLSHISTMLRMKRSEIRLAHSATEVSGSAELWNFDNLRFMLERSDGSVIPHNLLSYGQKRALAFLYYLDMNSETVIADELVDGLHHRWIVECIKSIADRQAFLASQNPLLLDHLEFDSARKVQSSFIQCRLESRDKAERMIWSNMSEYDSERFFEAYQVGLQQVSEILRTKDLW